MLTFLKKLASAVPTPSADKVTIFVDSSTGEPAYKDETGSTHSMVGADGQGVPDGGTAGQLLRKVSATDYDSEWHTLTPGDIGAQPNSTALTSIAGLTTSANQGIYTTAADTYATFGLTAAGRALLDDADAAAQRTTLGLGTAATAAASDFATAAQGTKADAAAVDTAVVHKDGAEDVTGSKRFTAADTAPIKSETANAETLWLTRTGRTPGVTTNSVVRYRIEYTNSTFSDVYFGMYANPSGVPTWAVGSATNLSPPENQWLAAAASGLTCRVPATFASSVTSGGTMTLRDIAFAADNTYNVGSASSRPIQYYGVNTTISSSDERLKAGIRQITDTEIAAFRAILRLPGVWQWAERVAEEGDDARLHSGPTVQAAIAIMEAHGLDWRKYAAFCYDEWPEQEEVVNSWPAEYDEDGNLVREAGSEVVQEYRPGGDRYSFRKEELLWWCLRAESAAFDQLEARVAALESGNSDAAAA